MAQKIKRNDMVKVIAGKDIDKEGKVLSVDAKNHKVVVEGINMATNIQNQACRIRQAVLFRKKQQSTYLTLCFSTTDSLQELVSSL